MNWVFRLHVRLKTPIDPKGLPATVTLPGFPPIEVSHQKSAPTTCELEQGRTCPQSPQPRPDGERFTFICRGYPSEAAAKLDGRRFSDALLAMGAVSSLGVDVGFSKPTGGFGQEIIENHKKDTGKDLLWERFGLMFYRNDTITIMGADAQLFITVSLPDILDRLSKWIKPSENLTIRQRTCAALLNDSQYVAQDEARFILCVSAVEALCGRAPLPLGHLSAIEALSDHLPNVTVDPEIREHVASILQNARQQAIRQAYLAKFRERLGEEAAKEFDKLYKRRSAFIHDGQGRGSLREAGTSARELAARLLEADVMATAAPA